MSRPFQLTPGRVRALRLVEGHDVYGSAFADQLFPRPYGWTRQGATRWGCGYAQPLVDAGLLRKDVHVSCGGARFSLTEAGLAALRQAGAA